MKEFDKSKFLLPSTRYKLKPKQSMDADLFLLRQRAAEGQFEDVYMLGGYPPKSPDYSTVTRNKAEPSEPKDNRKHTVGTVIPERDLQPVTPQTIQEIIALANDPAFKPPRG